MKYLSVMLLVCLFAFNAVAAEGVLGENRSKNPPNQECALMEAKRIRLERQNQERALDSNSQFETVVAK